MEISLIIKTLLYAIIYPLATELFALPKNKYVATNLTIFVL